MDAFLKGIDLMYDIHCISTSGYIAGEVKLTITLRLLAGGDALDLDILFDIDSCHYGILMYKVLLKWVITNDIDNLNMVNYLGHKETMVRVSAGFTERSNVALIGAIGSLDGWLVCVVRLSFWRDGIR